MLGHYSTYCIMAVGNMQAEIPNPRKPTPKLERGRAAVGDGIKALTLLMRLIAFWNFAVGCMENQVCFPSTELTEGSWAQWPRSEDLLLTLKEVTCLIEATRALVWGGHYIGRCVCPQVLLAPATPQPSPCTRTAPGGEWGREGLCDARGKIKDGQLRNRQPKLNSLIGSFQKF